MNKLLRSTPIRFNEQTSTVIGQGGTPGKVQLLRTGKFYDVRYGSFEITQDMLRKMKTNYDAKLRGVELAVDYAHESDKIAAGWIKAVELAADDTELWITVEWTPKGAKVLGDKEFGYLSADFHPDYEDNETRVKHGACLFGAGLTNRPVIKEMKSVIGLSEEDKQQLKDQITEIVKAELKGSVSIKTSEGGTMDPKDKEIADLKAKLEALQKEKEGMMSELADIKKKMGGYEAEQKQAAEAKALAEKKTAFDTMLSEGKVVEAQRESYMKDDIAGFTKLAQPVKLSEGGHGNNPPAGGGDIEAQVQKLADEKLKDKKAGDKGEAISMVLKENPELRKKYENRGN